MVFDLARDIDFHVHTMAESNERAVAGTTAGLIGEGETVTWKATHFGVPFRMTSKVTNVDRPNGFVDHQTRGPFARFRHVHRFTETADGLTLMIDEIDYDAPLGPIGRAVDGLGLATYMEKLLTDRSRLIQEEAERRSAS